MADSDVCTGPTVSDLFVANLGGSITEVDASTGAIVRVISGPAYHFDQPKSVGVTGNDLFVANLGSVTEVDASTGSLVRVITGR